MDKTTPRVTLVEPRLDPTETVITVRTLAEVFGRLIDEGYGNLPVYLSSEGVVGGLGEVTRVRVTENIRQAIWIGEAPRVGDPYVNGPQ